MIGLQTRVRVTARELAFIVMVAAAAGLLALALPSYAHDDRSTAAVLADD
jgi:hypothetical protein